MNVSRGTINTIVGQQGVHGAKQVGISKSGGTDSTISNNPEAVKRILDNFIKWPKEQMTVFLQAVLLNNARNLHHNQQGCFKQALSLGNSLHIPLLMINYIIEKGNIAKFYDTKIGFQSENFKLWLNVKCRELQYNIDSLRLSNEVSKYFVEIDFTFANIEIKHGSDKIFSLNFQELFTFSSQYSVTNSPSILDFSSIDEPTHIFQRYWFTFDTSDGMLVRNILSAFNKELDYAEKKNMISATSLPNYVFPPTQRKERAFFEALEKAVNQEIKEQAELCGVNVHLKQQIRVMFLIITYICDVGVENAFEKGEDIEYGEINFNSLIHWAGNDIAIKRCMSIIDLKDDMLSTFYDGDSVAFDITEEQFICLSQTELRLRNMEANLNIEVISEHKSEVGFESLSIAKEDDNSEHQLIEAKFDNNVKVNNNQTNKYDKETDPTLRSVDCLNDIECDTHRNFGGIIIKGQWEGDKLILNNPFTICYYSDAPVKVKNCKGTISANSDWKLTGEVTDYIHGRTVYSGYVENNLKHGRGIYTNFAGVKFEGMWKNNELDTSCPFKVTDLNNTILDVEEYNDITIDVDANWSLNGKVTMKYRSGTFKGNIENNRKCGYGVYTTKKGEQYEGVWKDGSINSSKVTVIFPEDHRFKLVLEGNPVYFDRFIGKITEDTFALKEGRLLPVANPSSSNTDEISFEKIVFQPRTCTGIYKSATQKFSGCFSLAGNRSDSNELKLRRGTMSYIQVLPSTTSVSYRGSFDEYGRRYGRPAELTLVSSVQDNHKIVIMSEWKKDKINSGLSKVKLNIKGFTADFEIDLSNLEIPYDFSRAVELLIKIVNEKKCLINYTNFENVSSYNNHNVGSAWPELSKCGQNAEYQGTVNEGFVPHGQGKVIDSKKLVFNGEFRDGKLWSGELMFLRGDTFVYTEGKIIQIKYKNNSTVKLSMDSQSSVEIWVYKESAENDAEFTLFEEKTQSKNKWCETGSKRVVILADGSKMEEVQHVNNKKLRERIYSDGRHYKGNMDSHGNPSGSGRLIFSDGVVHDGIFKNGLLSKGQKTFPNKEYDKGGFDENEKMTGFGTRCRDGKKIISIFKNDEADGEKGTIKYAKDKVDYEEEGTFAQGKQVGVWKISVTKNPDKYSYDYYKSYDINGNPGSTISFDYGEGHQVFAYEGDFGGVDGTEPHGNGEIYYLAEGSVYKGGVKSGKKDGIGKLSSILGTYEGQFKDGKSCGWLNSVITSPDRSQVLMEFSGKGLGPLSAALGISRSGPNTCVGNFSTFSRIGGIIPDGEVAVFTGSTIELGVMNKGKKTGLWTAILASQSAQTMVFKDGEPIDRPEPLWCNALAELSLMKIHQQVLSACLFEDMKIVQERKETEGMRIIYANKDEYLGISVGGQKLGKGKFTFAGGYIVYSGEFNDSGKFHGMGKLTLGTSHYIGLFCNGKFVSGTYKVETKERNVIIYSKFNGLVPQGKVCFEDVVYKQTAYGQIDDQKFIDTWFCITDKNKDGRPRAYSMGFNKKSGKENEKSVKQLNFQEETGKMKIYKKQITDLNKEDQLNYLTKKQLPRVIFSK